MRKISIHPGTLSLALSLLVTVAADAAPITWSSTPYTVSGSYGQTLNTGQFATNGTQILAENIGGGAFPFDGINFTAATINLGSGTFTGFHDGGANTALAREGSYGPGGVASTVTLTGLTSGRTYRVQALVYDGRGGTTGRTVRFDGINQGQYANGVTNVTWGNGLLVTGNFVADAATQNFTIEAFSGGSSVGGQLNALVVHEFTPGIPDLTNPAVTSITTTTAQAGVDLLIVGADVTLRWDTVDQGTGTWANSNPLGTQPVGPVSGAITSLAGDTLYFYRFQAVNTGADPDTEAWSPAGATFATALAGKAPAGPAAAAVSATRIDVTWTDNFDTETGFVIERSPNGIDTWTQAGTTGPNTGSFSDIDLLPSTPYHYRVSARNGAGLSDLSSVASATTNAATPGITVQSWFRMGDAGQGSNNLPLDASGNARHFTSSTGATSTIISPNGGGYSNDAYYTFNGVNQSYFITGYDAPENNVGIEAWVRTSDLAQLNHHVFGTGSNQNGINVGYEASGNLGWFGAVGGVAFAGSVGTANYTAGDWIHLAVVRETGITTFYVNGVASGTSSATPNNATAPHLAVNAGGAPGAYFGGDVAEARIFTFDPGQFNTALLLYPGTGPGDPYGDWADSFPGLSDPSAELDFDQDGLATGIEWVTGGNPTINDAAAVTPVLDNVTSPTHLLFTFRRRDAAAADPATRIVVEYGGNLATWRNTEDHGVADGVTIDDSTDLGGGFHQVTVAIPRSLATGSSYFARLRVDIAP